MLNDNTPIITCRCKMNPSNNQGNNISSQWSEWSSASASSASKRDEVFDDSQQRFHAQQVNVAAMRNNHDIFPRFADHTYRDFSTWIKDGNKIEKHKKSDRNFPARLHAMLSDENFSHIISWMPHGRAWKVINKELLVEEVIPKFFGQSKYASFTRQLSGWGLKRLHQTGPDFGCYYHECFLKGHPKLTALMRRVPPGQGKVTPNMHAEPDFYLMAERHPLEPSDDVPDRHNEKGLESKISVSGRQKSGFPGDFEASGYARGDDLLLTRKTATPNMGSMSNQHQWDPFDTGVDSAHLHHPEAPPESAMNQYGGNPANLLSTKRSSQPQPFASTDGTKKDESNAHEEMNFDPLPVSYQNSGARYRDRGYLDPFPEPNHLMAPHSGYHMYPAHRHQEYYGSNINQYAAAAAAGMSQSHQAAGYYYPPSHFPQSHQYSDSHNNMSNQYWYGNNPYYNNHQSAQGLAHAAQGYPQAQDVNDTARPQPHYPNQAEGDGNNHNSTRSLPSFSPMKYAKEDESKKSDSKPQN